MAEINHQRALTSLLDKNFNDAWFYFVSAENASNGFNQSYEIANYLRNQNTKTKTLEFWRELYATMLEKYSIFIEDKIKAQIGLSILSKNDSINIRIYFLNGKTELKSKLLTELKEFYTNVEIKNLDIKPNWFASEPTILYYHQKSKSLCIGMKYLLEELCGREFSIKIGAGLGVNQSNSINEFRIHIN